MKTKIIVSVAFILLLIPVILTAQWVRQSPLPTGLHLQSVHFISPAHGFAVGINRLLLETTDGGASWVVRMSDVLGSDPFYRISFSDSLNGFISGNSTGIQRDLWRTADGGQSWSRMTNFPLGGSWRLIDFVAPSRAYMGSNGACAFTSDGGDTWILKSGYPDAPIMFGMDFRDEQVALVGGLLQGSDGIFKTTDGGVSWHQKYSSAANDVLWWTANIAFATIGTSVYRSTDAGETWTVFASGISTGLLELERVNNTTLAGVSGKGDIWRSTNEGITWTHVFDGPGDLPASWSIHFMDGQHGWVVGQSGFIYTSDDGGITWRQVNNGAGIQLYDLEMLTDNFGIGVGHNGYVFRTTNGGSWWQVSKLEVTGQIFGRDESLHGVSVVDSGFAVVAGPGGTVFRTYNGGINWESIGYPVLPGLFWIEDVKFVSRTEGWIVGQDQDLGHTRSVYHTTDGGTTWTQAMSQSSYMWAVDFVDAQHGWIATIGSLYFRTTNGGATWLSNSYPPYFMSPTVSDIQFVNQNIGWAVGWDGFVARSVDGGASWTYKDIGTTEDHIFAVRAVSPNEAWLTGREANFPMDGVIYHTTNGGATWTREVFPPYPYWGYTITGSENNIWIGGYEGRIFKKTLTVGISINSEEIPNRFILEQNYPNPFNPATVIKYAIPKTGNVELKIYDMLGREVKSLVNEVKRAGSYEEYFDASGLASGTYLYKLSANDFTETKKMIFAK